MKKQPITSWTLSVFLILTLLISTGNILSLAKANPYLHETVKQGEVPPPNGTKPPEILIFSPKNNTTYPASISLSFNVSVLQPKNGSLPLSELVYEGSWQSEKTTVNIDSLYRLHNNTFPFNVAVNLTDVPEGPHWMTINATATGFGGWTGTEYGHNTIGHTVAYDYYVTYSLTTYAVLNFTVDITPPQITISIENKTYNTPDIPLCITANEQLSEITYCLDLQENVTTSLNSTLTNLYSGTHNITIYAKDLAGNYVKSEDVFFSIKVAEPLSINLASIVVGTTAATLSVGLIFYVFKRNHRGWK